jgi:hypothetical protein
MAMRVPATDYEMGTPDPGVTDKEFDRRADLVEGINGRDAFDSRYENTERTQVLAPRGDARGRPMPRDAKFRGADNHGEWGNDQFREALEFGMDGPISESSYRGAGLPTRCDLSYPANRNHKDAALGLPSTINRPPVSDSEIGLAPMNDGIDGDN